LPRHKKVNDPPRLVKHLGLLAVIGIAPKDFQDRGNFPSDRNGPQTEVDKTQTLKHCHDFCRWVPSYPNRTCRFWELISLPGASWRRVAYERAEKTSQSTAGFHIPSGSSQHGGLNPSGSILLQSQAVIIHALLLLVLPFIRSRAKSSCLSRTSNPQRFRWGRIDLNPAY